MPDIKEPGGRWRDAAERAYDTPVGHSAHYHRRFAGYTETMAEGEDGKRRIVRIYTGDWYTVNLTTKGSAAAKAVRAALCLAATSLFTLSAAADTPGNRAMPTQVLQFGAVASLLWLLVALVTCLVSPARMTEYEYAAGPLRLMGACGTSTALLIAHAVCAAAFTALSGDGRVSQGLMYAGASLLAALAAFAARHMETRITYTKTPSETVPPAGGYVIGG